MDEQVARRAGELATLMDQFVCVRIVQCYGADLSQFQFDFNQTLAFFFANADGTIYGRYGTRFQRNPSREMTLEGLRKAMAGALELHAAWPMNRAQLAGKKGESPRWKTADAIPALQGRFQPAERNDKKCFHCHFVTGGEIISARRESRKPLADRLIWPYPSPALLGLEFNPRERAQVAHVRPGSPADRAGLRTGDKIVRAAGQPLVSIADFAWVLHRAEEPTTLQLEVVRDGKASKRELILKKGWRRHGDLSWQALAWMFGDEILGLHVELVPPHQRTSAGLPAGKPAYRIKRFVPGWYEGGNHISRKVGLQKGDLIVGVNGKAPPPTHSLWLAWIAQETRSGQPVTFEIARGTRRLKIKLPVQ